MWFISVFYVFYLNGIIQWYRVPALCFEVLNFQSKMFRVYSSPLGLVPTTTRCPMGTCKRPQTLLPVQKPSKRKQRLKTFFSIHPTPHGMFPIQKKKKTITC